ncbi:hypothetical protein V496_00319 [Pseudogymnoascus sp. VKM F-4515 (FW-2607)]|nr:hypothetical protein V496_00319 [Pseudogymnoascus sp. VKM F-4515 (FW-2607)]
METDTTASPPSYTQAVSDAADDLLQPVILVLDNQSIHAESDPTVPLYQVNRSIANLGRATSVVEFARMERSAGTAKQRSRHIYNLHHRQPMLRVPFARHAEYFIQAVAAPARRLGHLGLKQACMAEHWTALPVDMKGWTEMDRPPFVADAAPVLEAHHRQGAYKWTDGDGRDVAIDARRWMRWWLCGAVACGSSRWTSNRRRLCRPTISRIHCLWDGRSFDDVRLEEKQQQT